MACRKDEPKSNASDHPASIQHKIAHWFCLLSAKEIKDE